MGKNICNERRNLFNLFYNDENWMIKDVFYTSFIFSQVNTALAMLERCPADTC